MKIHMNEKKVTNIQIKRRRQFKRREDERREYGEERRGEVRSVVDHWRALIVESA